MNDEYNGHASEKKSEYKLVSAYIEGPANDGDVIEIGIIKREKKPSKLSSANNNTA